MPFSGFHHEPRCEFGADSASNKPCVFDLRQLFTWFVFFLQQTKWALTQVTAIRRKYLLGGLSLCSGKLLTPKGGLRNKGGGECFTGVCCAHEGFAHKEGMHLVVAHELHVGYGEDAALGNDDAISGNT